MPDCVVTDQGVGIIPVRLEVLEELASAECRISSGSRDLPTREQQPRPPSESWRTAESYTGVRPRSRARPGPMAKRSATKRRGRPVSGGEATMPLYEASNTLRTPQTGG